jgi:solute carrier family 6 dopamine transporter-like protein 3
MEVFILLNYYKIMLVYEEKQDIFFFLGIILIFILAFYSIIIAVLFEAIAVSWLYGINRISDDVKEMLGSKPGKFWIITWCVAAPLFLGVMKLNKYFSTYILSISRVLFFLALFNMFIRLMED